MFLEEKRNTHTHTITQATYPNTHGGLCAPKYTRVGCWMFTGILFLIYQQLTFSSSRILHKKNTFWCNAMLFPNFDFDLEQRFWGENSKWGGIGLSASSQNWVNVFWLWPRWPFGHASRINGKAITIGQKFEKVENHENKSFVISLLWWFWL